MRAPSPYAEHFKKADHFKKAVRDLIQPYAEAMTRWTDAVGEDRGQRYAQRFATLEASGADVHGEARFCETLVPPGALVLDAGCGTGRVGIELSRTGRHCVGVDADRSMLEQAKRADPAIRWLEQDLAALDLVERFDLILTAGNVIPLLTAGTEAQTVSRLAAHLNPQGVLVSGFGLEALSLPLASAPFGLAEYDGWCEEAELELVARFATWDRQPYDGGGYAISVHRSSGNRSRRAASALR